MTAAAKAPSGKHGFSELQCKPFVKAAGGKTQLLEVILPHLTSPNGPDRNARYFEPFVGGGAVFFALRRLGRFSQSFLNDRNLDLINAYEMVAEKPNKLIMTLTELGQAFDVWRYEYRDHGAHWYSQTRARYNALRFQVGAQWHLCKPAQRVEAAALFIALNRTCFNGLWRVNKEGAFNVPFGRYTNPKIRNADVIREAGRALNGAIHQATITCTDFSLAALPAHAGDVVYFDPPYLPLSKTADFTAYTKEGFKAEDHRALLALSCDLVERGCRVVLSEGASPAFIELFESFTRERPSPTLTVHRVSAKRAINSKGDRRGAVDELLIVGG